MKKTLALAIAAVALSAPAWAQTRDNGPMSPCTLTPAQIEEGRKVALQFFAHFVLELLKLEHVFLLPG